MIGKPPAIDPTAPEPFGFGHRSSYAGHVARRRAIGPAQRHKAGITLGQPMAGPHRTPFDAHPQVTGQCERDEIGIGGDDLVICGTGVLPSGIGTAIVEGWLAIEHHVDSAVQAGRRADEHVIGVEVARRAPVQRRAVARPVPGPDGHEVPYGQPTGTGLPGGRQHHRAPHVPAVGGHGRVCRRQPERPGGPIKDHAEDARVVRSGQAQPLDRPGGRHQAGVLTVGEEGIVGDGRKDCFQ